eukprot:TRINITY_DN48352_c0_g1_i1.p1 TRINITY_DN48352_c0_g1~~TRINITY_DN48352_c0_g1_i1.p1  ORF type:complete len:531 (-),score=75.05 TRINITY_DN48352_c0_g1_i1:47-1639(-)
MAVGFNGSLCSLAVLPSDELSVGLVAYATRRHAAYVLPDGVSVTVFDAPGDAVETRLQTVAAKAPEVIGLDTEWTDPRGTIALLQLAISGECLLLRPECLRPPPQALVDLLVDKGIIKAGVGIARDLQLLEEQFGLRVHGAVELQGLASRHGYLQHGNGLAGICLSVLGKKLAKDGHIRCSSWSDPLDSAQINYAACDAYVAVELVVNINQRHATQGTSLLGFCSGLVDCLKFPKLSRGQAACAKSCGMSSKQSGKAGKGDNAPLPRVLVRKSPLYGGCRMLAPDGTHIACVSRGKADWYIMKGLATIDSSEPFIFRLHEAPNGLGHAGDEFYLQVMENHCVGCAGVEGLVRYSIIPHAFRAHLPRQFKEHSSHDITLLCLTCFKVAADAAAVHRRALLSRFNVKDTSSEKCVINVEMERARRAASAICRNVLPPAVREAKLSTVRAFLKRPADALITDAELAEVSTMSTRFESAEYVSAEVDIARHLRLDEEVCCHDFVVAWRRVFVDALQPRHLPRGWNVERNIDRSH